MIDFCDTRSNAQTEQGWKKYSCAKSYLFFFFRLSSANSFDWTALKAVEPIQHEPLTRSFLPQKLGFLICLGKISYLSCGSFKYISSHLLKGFLLIIRGSSWYWMKNYISSFDFSDHLLNLLKKVIWIEVCYITLYSNSHHVAPTPVHFFLNDDDLILQQAWLFVWCGYVGRRGGTPSSMRFSRFFLSKFLLRKTLQENSFHLFRIHFWTSSVLLKLNLSTIVG